MSFRSIWTNCNGELNTYNIIKLKSAYKLVIAGGININVAANTNIELKLIKLDKLKSIM